MTINEELLAKLSRNTGLIPVVQIGSFPYECEIIDIEVDRTCGHIRIYIQPHPYFEVKDIKSIIDKP